MLSIPQSRPALNSSQQLKPQPSVYFGWTKEQLAEKPDTFTVKIRQDEDDVEYSTDGELHPKPHLAEKIASRIARDGDFKNIAGFVHIPNLSDLIPAKDNQEMYSKTYKFIDELTPIVYQKFSELIPKMKQWQDKVESLSFYRPDGKAQNDQGKKFPKKESLKSFHKDPHSVIACHAYGPMKNIDGGSLMILDDQQAAHDHNVHFTDLYERRPTEQGNIPCTPLLKQEWADKIAEDSPYIFSVDTHPGKTDTGLDRIPVFVFNNLEVGHGATRVTAIGAEEGQRGFYRSSIATKDDAETGELPFLPFHNPKYHSTES